MDLVFGPQTYHRLPSLVEKAASNGKRIVDTEFPIEDKFDYLPDDTRNGLISRFLTIQEGCDRFAPSVLFLTLGVLSNHARRFQ